LSKKRKAQVVVVDSETGKVEYKPSLVKALNIVAVILALILLIVIYIPKKLWEEEEYYRNIGRKRMSILYEVEKYYHQMANRYETDPILAMKILTAVRDSTLADSDFYGKQEIKLPEGKFSLDVVRNFYQIFDTTFALSYEKKDTVVDTSYKVIKWNTELFAFDTIWVNSSRINDVMKDSLFRALLDTEITSRVATQKIFRPFKLDSHLAYNPLINKQFQILVDSEGITIKDPMKKYKEMRYLVFAFKDTNYGYIKNGEKSWEKR